jgi:tRNA1(Val) A37 N6-methylase TrmN6
MNKEYSQPDFYRFNSDSFILVDRIARNQKNYGRVLDLGCGCGIIGIEIVNKLEVHQITFLEAQRGFETHLLNNINRFIQRPINVEVKWDSFSHVEFNDCYDLIVCNPPYYLPGHGQVSKDEQRMIARTFIKDSWDDLFNLLEKYLSSEGSAFFVVKDDPTIWGHILNALKKFNLFFKQEKTRDVLLLEVFRLNKN